MKGTPQVGVRLSVDREHVVIIFGGDDEDAYYGVFTPQQALRIAKEIRQRAETIKQVRGEVLN